MLQTSEPLDLVSDFREDIESANRRSPNSSTWEKIYQNIE